MSAHADPEFYEKYEFCRLECAECKRLDDEDTRDPEEKNRIGIAMAVKALRAEGIIP